MQRTVDGLTIECIQGDITAQPDCRIIVNAANSQLKGGGGVDGAINRAAGPELVKASRELGPIEAGEAVITPAFDLPNDYVIHCVGPVYDGSPRVAEQLANCHLRAMELAAETGADSIAFPAISTGVYRYPVHEASRIALRAVADCAANAGKLTLVRFVLFSRDALAVYDAALDSV